MPLQVKSTLTLHLILPHFLQHELLTLVYTSAGLKSSTAGWLIGRCSSLACSALDPNPIQCLEPDSVYWEEESRFRNGIRGRLLGK